MLNSADEPVKVTCARYAKRMPSLQNAPSMWESKERACLCVK